MKLLIAALLLAGCTPNISDKIPYVLFIKGQELAGNLPGGLASPELFGVVENFQKDLPRKKQRAKWSLNRVDVAVGLRFAAEVPILGGGSVENFVRFDFVKRKK